MAQRTARGNIDRLRTRVLAKSLTRLRAWCDRRLPSSNEPVSHGWAAPWSKVTRGQGGLTLVDQAPLVQPAHQDPEASARSIIGFTNQPRAVSGPIEGPGSELRREAAELSWYHTLELPHGVVTPGTYDHRGLVPYYGFADSLVGKRALDVATADGFWAFEMERRGAAVTAIDVAQLSDHDFPPSVRTALASLGFDRPTGAGFKLAHQALGSDVRRQEQSLYEMNGTNPGNFDIVHMADVLLHLERPLDALRAVRAVTCGYAHIVDVVSPEMPPGAVQYRGNWGWVQYWLPSVEALVQMVADAGFSSVRLHRLYGLAGTQFPDAVGPWRAIVLAKP